MDAQDLLAALDEMVSGVGELAGLRLNAWYRPVGGAAAKLSPPTYAGDRRYITERRFGPDGELVDVVLLDSIQAQANRCEEALLALADAGRLDLPYLELRTDVDGWHVRLTSLDAPHRSRDAYFRDSRLGGSDFEKSDIGVALRKSDRNALRPFFEHSPADLVYGFWDSQRGGRQFKVARAYVSELIGWQPEIGVRGAGRLDPLVNMRAEASKISIEGNDRSEWTLDEKGKAKLSEVNLGMVPPGLREAGVSVKAVQRVGYLNGVALSRLGFAASARESTNAASDGAARAVLAALAVVGDRAAFSGAGLSLRSGCDLVLDHEELAWVRREAADEPATIDLELATSAFELALERARSMGLRWRTGALALTPKPNLQQLIELAYTRAESDEG